jgi:thiol-disulfide isomerase/thioredoxin
MYKINILIITLLATSIHLFSQSHKYSIKGEIKGVKNGVIFLYPGNVDNKYFPKSQINDSAKIIDGKFSFKREQQSISLHAYRFFIKSNVINGLTDMVFIAPHNQYIVIDSINEYIAPIITSSISQMEIRKEYNLFFRELIKENSSLDEYSDAIYLKYGKIIPVRLSDSLNCLFVKLSNKSDSLFYKYATNHPNSLVTLWKLIERFNSNGYKIQYQSIYNLLTTRVKGSSGGQLIRKELENARILSIGNSFPIVKVKSNISTDSILNIKAEGNKIVLIDFWFSRCSPCLKQFPRLKMLYEKYKELGFLIVGISIDDSKEIENWKKVIIDLKLNWPQYLDENGSFSNSVFIKSFPTNFLLNQNGKIIAKNISISELESYLKMDARQQYMFDKIRENEPQ